MTISFELTWWAIPAAVTMLLTLWAVLSADVSDGYFKGIASSLIPVAIVVSVVWCLSGVFK